MIEINCQGRVILLSDEDRDLCPLTIRVTGHVLYEGRGLRQIVGARIGLIETKELFINHKDRNKLNNQRNNLWLLTHEQCMWNVDKSRRSKNKYKGVVWIAHKKKFSVLLSVGGVQTKLGYFDNEEEAARWYDLHCLKHRGEFAVLNFPELRSKYLELIKVEMFK